jgi:hypothetical protein
VYLLTIVYVSCGSDPPALGSVDGAVVTNPQLVPIDSDILSSSLINYVPMFLLTRA